MLNLLDPVKDDVFIINSLHGMREENNKLYTAAFGGAHSNIIPNHLSVKIKSIKCIKSKKLRQIK
jgi:glutathione synthase